MNNWIPVLASAVQLGTVVSGIVNAKANAGLGAHRWEIMTFTRTFVSVGSLEIWALLANFGTTLWLGTGPPHSRAWNVSAHAYYALAESAFWDALGWRTRVCACVVATSGVKHYTAPTWLTSLCRKSDIVHVLRAICECV